MMKQTLTSRPHRFVLALGGLGLLLRRLLYLAAVDEKGLLVPGHPLELCLWLLTAAVMAWIFLSLRKLEGSGDYKDNFSPSLYAALGQAAMALAIAFTAVPNAPALSGGLGTVWKLLGILSVPCLLAAAYCRLKGIQPFFLLHILPCLFLVLHIVNHYRVWSSQPQIQNYCFSLLGLMALVLFSFYTGAFAVDMPRRRMQTGTGLAALFLCLTALAHSDSPWLLLGGALWALTGLCSLNTAHPSAEGGPV